MFLRVSIMSMIVTGELTFRNYWGAENSMKSPSSTSTEEFLMLAIATASKAIQTDKPQLKAMG